MLRFSRDPLLQKEDDLDDEYDDDDDCDEENGDRDTVYDNNDDMEDLEEDLLEDDDCRDDNVLEIRIKSGKDVTVRMADPDNNLTVLDLKHAAAAALEKSVQDHYIRLIRNGRMLAPDCASLQDLGVATGDVIHAVMTTLAPGTGTGAGAGGTGAGGTTATSIRQQPQGPQAQLQRGTTAFQRRAFRGAGINAAGLAVRDANADGSPSGDSENEQDNDDDDDVEAAAARLGFDRLRNSGMRRAEVTAMRSYFSRHVDRWIRQNTAAAEAAAGTESDPMRRRLMQEDAWMQAQGPASEFRLNLAGSWQARSLMMSSMSSNMAGMTAGMNNDALWRSNGSTGMHASVGTDRDFLWGFMLGFFVGFLMLVWVWMPTVPHKQKLGILTGISLQLAFGMMKNAEQGDDDFVN
jgi:hypothetical protein